MFRHFAAIGALALFLLSAANVQAASSTSASLKLVVPANADTSTSIAVSFSLPVGTAAVDGRLLLDKSAAEVVGLAPVGGGVALVPVEISGGYAFGSYNLSTKGKPTIRIIIAPQVPGQIELNLVIDSAANAAGQRITLASNSASGALVVEHGRKIVGAPAKSTKPGPTKSAGPTHDVLADGALGKMDLDIVRAAWEFDRRNGVSCGSGDLSADANGDGCIDIVDLQSVAVAQGKQFVTTLTYKTSDTVAAGVAA